MNPQAPQPLAHRRDIDGLRAVAILPVLLYHAGFGWVSGGYVGVDVFFVISGFLITSIILREADRGQFSIIRFYERRARRILPALMFVLLACTVTAWSWMTPDELRRFGQSLAAVQVFGSNIYFWQTTNYFSGEAEELPLLHTWSLAVEEQYYLLFPLLLLFLRRKSPRRFAVALMGLALGSLALAEWGARHSPVANFYLLPTRAWELLAGSMLANWATGIQGLIAGRHRLAEVGSLAGMLMVLASILMYDTSTPFPSLWTLLPVVGAMLIIACSQHGTMVGAMLSMRPMVGIGLISYSAYLWHWPVLVFARYTPLDLSNAYVKAALAAASLLMAAVSWRFVEQPFRERRWLAQRPTLFFASGAGVAAMLLAGLVLHAGNGFPSRGNQEALRPSVNEFATVENGWCFYSVDSISRLVVGPGGWGCHLGDRSAARRGLLVGDSFAGHFEPFWDALGKQYQFGLESVATNWCFPSLKERYTGPPTSRAYEQCVLNRRHIAGNMHKYDFIVVSADWRNVLKQGMLDDALEFIAESAKSGRPVIVMPTPRRFDRDAFRRMQRASFFASPIDISSAIASEDRIAVEANQRVQAFSHRFPNTVFLTRDQVFQIAGVPTDLSTDNITFSADGRHISVYGSLAAAQQFKGTDGFRRIVDAIRAYSTAQTSDPGSAPSPPSPPVPLSSR